MCKQFYFIVFFVFTFSTIYSQKMVSKYIFHQVVVKDVKTDRIINDFGSGSKGIIIYYKDDKNEWITIGINDELGYEIKVVQTIIDHPDENIKVEMKKGGIIKDGKFIGAISVFRVFNLSKNKVIPEFIRTYVDGADNAIEYQGIIEIN